ncbi:unnamed protein product [Rotaria sp. Silwood1]|nr:unnamed protein product [Rotaria sp. Silwood1]
MFIIPLFLIHCLTSISAKVTYFNLENIYGPYCNPRNTYTPDAGVVRYAGTPWTGTCELNLQSCCFPAPRNLSQMGNIAVSTRFYIRLLKPPLCSTEDVTIISESGEKGCSLALYRFYRPHLITLGCVTVGVAFLQICTIILLVWLIKHIEKITAFNRPVIPQGKIRRLSNEITYYPIQSSQSVK